MKHKNITNAHFAKLKDVINTCVGSHMNGASIISNMQDASLDNKNSYYVYPSTVPVNLDVIKLDDITKYRKHFLLPKINFEPLSGVDAICINSQNEWFFLEFKNCDIKNNSKERKSIRKAFGMFFSCTLWQGKISSICLMEILQNLHARILIILSLEANAKTYCITPIFKHWKKQDSIIPLQDLNNTKAIILKMCICLQN